MVSFGYIVIASILLIGTMIYSIMLIPINGIFTVYNGFIADGMATQQNADAMGFQRNVLLVVPIIILLGCMAWGIVRALEKRNEERIQ